MSTSDETRERGEGGPDELPGARRRTADEMAISDLSAPGLGVTDEVNPGETDRPRLKAEAAWDQERAGVRSTGDVDLEDPDNEVQTTTERAIDEAASEAGRHIAAAARAGWDDPARAADPRGGYDLMAPPGATVPEQPDQPGSGTPGRADEQTQVWPSPGAMVGITIPDPSDPDASRTDRPSSRARRHQPAVHHGLPCQLRLLCPPGGRMPRAIRGM